jgi:cytidylate kinase
MAPDSIKIFITCDFDEGVRRVFQATMDDPKKNEGRYTTWEELRPQVQARMETDRKRYIKYYGVDAFDPANFDIVIDSTGITAEEVAERIIEKL